MWRFILLTFCAWFISLICEGHATLVYVQMLFRHGDRSPIELYPTDPNKDYEWPEGLGMLTPRGMRQHYGHGKYLRKLYSEFITTNPKEVKILSSGADRCIRSAECNLATFYAPAGKWKFEKDVNWQPLTVNYVPVHNDKYLETGSYCPRADEEEQKVINSPEGQKIVKENEEMFQYLTLHSGRNITGWKVANYLYDVLMIEKYYNLTIPSWATVYWDQLKNVSILSFYWNFNSPELLRLRAGPFIGLVIRLMEAKISNEIPDAKVQIYSGHDTNIAAVLHALNMYNMVPPPYCATLIFELHDINGHYAVRFLYLNSTTPEKGDQTPHILILDGCSEFCPFEYFKNYSSGLIPENWKEECKLKPQLCEDCAHRGYFPGSELREHAQIELSKESFAIIYTLAAMVCVLFAAAFYLLWKLRQHGLQRDEYCYHLMPDMAS